MTLVSIVSSKRDVPSGVQVTLVHPAFDKDVLRYERQLSSYVEETPQLYATHTLPYIRGEHAPSTQVGTPCSTLYRMGAPPAHRCAMLYVPSHYKINMDL